MTRISHAKNALCSDVQPLRLLEHQDQKWSWQAAYSCKPIWGSPLGAAVAMLCTIVICGIFSYCNSRSLEMVLAGELTPALAWVLVVGLAVCGVAICARNFGPAITKLYSLGLFLGTIYSVPPFRLKRFAIPAFLIIATVRGFLLNFGVYSATRAALGLEFQWSPAIL